MYVNAHTHKPFAEGETGIFQLNKIQSYESGCFSVGIHPWNVQNVEVEEELQKIYSLAKSNKKVVIGECGIDRACNVDLDLQENIFKKQLQIAMEFNKPMVVHCVKAYADLLKILKIYNPKVPIILHAFNGNAQIISQFEPYNAYFSLGSNLFANKKQEELLLQISQNKLFLETDVSEVSIKEIYTKASEILRIKEQELKAQIYKNFIRIY